MTKPIGTLACLAALVLLLFVGCWSDTGESPDGEEQPPTTEGATDSPGDETGTESPGTSGWGGIEGVPPPKLVDIRQVEQRYDDEDRTRRSLWQVKFFSDETTVKHGEYIEWYPDGSELCRGRYTDDMKDGEWTYWSLDGKKAKNGRYRNGKLDGRWVYYNDEENPLREENYKDGLKNGPQIMFYDNGVEKQRIEFVDDKPHGTAVLRDKDGSETGKLIYENGKLVKRIPPGSD